MCVNEVRWGFGFMSNNSLKPSPTESARHVSVSTSSSDELMVFAKVGRAMRTRSKFGFGLPMYRECSGSGGERADGLKYGGLRHNSEQTK